MALRFADSFDHYSTGDLLLKWSALLSSPSISAGNGRRSTACLSLSNSTVGVEKIIDAQATWIVGFAFYTSSLPGSASSLLTLMDAGSIQTDIRILSDGTIRATRNGTTLATSSNALSATTYYYIEVKITVSDASGIVEVRVNGSSTGWINITSQDTKNTSNASADLIRITGMLGATTRIDDLYICDASGSTNNDFLGDVRVDCLLPNANGNSSQLVGSDADSTDNYALVDEASQNGDTDYVQSSTTSEKDTYAVANLSHLPTSIFGVQINMVAKKDDSGARAICAVTRSGGSDTDGATQAVSTAYAVYREIRETDPNTSAAWTRNNLNNAQFGVKVAA